MIKDALYDIVINLACLMLDAKAGITIEISDKKFDPTRIVIASAALANARTCCRIRFDAMPFKCT